VHHPYHIRNLLVRDGCWQVFFFGRAGTLLWLETGETRRALLGMDTYIRHTTSLVRGMVYLDKAMMRAQYRRVRTKLRCWMVGGWRRRLVVSLSILECRSALSCRSDISNPDKGGETDGDRHACVKFYMYSMHQIVRLVY
jgi:hypothetical protein